MCSCGKNYKTVMAKSVALSLEIVNLGDHSRLGYSRFGRMERIDQEEREASKLSPWELQN